MSASLYADQQPRPEVNVLVVSLVLFFAYMITSALAAFGLAAAGMALHPATRIFIWFVITYSVGFSLLKRHRVYPTRVRLGLILSLTILCILFMSISILLKLGDGSLSSAASQSIAIDMLVNTVALFIIGAFGLSVANWAYTRNQNRP